MVWKRKLDGSLGRLPRGFHERVWFTLTRTPGGLKLGAKHLPAQPTLNDLTVHEMNFSLQVEDLLSDVKDPILRQVVVEVSMQILIRKRQLLVSFCFHRVVNYLLQLYMAFIAVQYIQYSILRCNKLTVQYC